MKLRALFLPIFASLFLSSPVQGQEPDSLVLSPLFLLDDENSAADATVQTVRLGEPILELAIATKSGAVLNVSRPNEDLGWFPLAGQIVLREAVPVDAQEQGDARGKVYCTGQFESSFEEQQLAAKQSLSLPERGKVRACFIDSEGDGDFEKVFISGYDIEPLGNTVEISPISYRKGSNLPLGNSRWRLVAKKEDRTRKLGALGFLSQRRVFQAQTNAATGRFEEVYSYLTEDACGNNQIAVDTGFKVSRLPRRYQFGCAQIEVTDFDKRSQTLSYRITERFSAQPVLLQVRFLDLLGGTTYTIK